MYHHTSDSLPFEISNESMGEILLKLLSLNYINQNNTYNNEFNEYINTYSLTELGRDVFLQLSRK